MSAPTPPPDVGAEVEVTPELVDALVRAQHPDCAGPVRRFSTGWDNEVLRVGDALLARMPRRTMGADNLVREARWLPAIASGLTLPAPVHLRAGVPDATYPFPWALVPWLPGEPAARGDFDPAVVAGQLLDLFAALHVPCAPDAPVDAARGMPLARRDAQIRELLARHPDPDESDALRTRWEAGLHAEPWAGPRVWVHGDLHPYNVLVRDGRLSAVLDWGDLFGGDPAPDLAGGCSSSLRGTGGSAAPWTTRPGTVERPGPPTSAWSSRTPVDAARAGDSRRSAGRRCRGWWSVRRGHALDPARRRPRALRPARRVHLQPRHGWRRPERGPRGQEAGRRPPADDGRAHQGGQAERPLEHRAHGRLHLARRLGEAEGG
ncbi:MAG: phosphotransferase [Myxococcales bacterium]|nr:phosphotransferase [Myxococcales bacterium]